MYYVDTNPKLSIFQTLCVMAEGSHYAFKLLHMNLADRKRRAPLIPHKEHSHDVYHVSLYRSGSGKFLLNGHSTPCAKGSLVLTSPGQAHDFGPEGDEELEFAELTFSFIDNSGKSLLIPFEELLSLQFGQRIIEPEMPITLPDWKAEQLFGLLKSCYEALSKRNLNGEAPVASAFLRVFLFLVETLLPSIPHDSNDELYLRLLKVKDQIERDFSRKLDLGSLSKLCGMAPSHLCRSFKQYFGCPPIEYALRRRVEAAKVFLSSSGLPCKEIAALTGFHDPIYFNRTFKSRCGIAPLAFRRRSHLQ